MKLLAAAGLALAALAAALSWKLWGSQAGIAAASFGLLAVVIQLAASALIAPFRGAEFKVFAKKWGMGMALRFLGVVSIAVAAALDPVHFPPVPMAVGFLGVLMPLLLLEAKLIR